MDTRFPDLGTKEQNLEITTCFVSRFMSTYEMHDSNNNAKPYLQSTLNCFEDHFAWDTRTFGVHFPAWDLSQADSIGTKVPNTQALKCCRQLATCNDLAPIGLKISGLVSSVFSCLYPIWEGRWRRVFFAPTTNYVYVSYTRLRWCHRDAVSTCMGAMWFDWVARADPQAASLILASTNIISQNLYGSLIESTNRGKVCFRDGDFRSCQPLL